MLLLYATIVSNASLSLTAFFFKTLWPPIDTDRRWFREKIPLSQKKCLHTFEKALFCHNIQPFFVCTHIATAIHIYIAPTNEYIYFHLVGGRFLPNSSTFFSCVCAALALVYNFFFISLFFIYIHNC